MSNSRFLTWCRNWVRRIRNFFQAIYHQTIYRIIFSYLVFLLFFAFFLLLPFSWKNGKDAFNFLNAFYLAVSAFTTTGLTVVDIASQMTWFGQFLIWVLIFVGGIGLLFFKVTLFYYAYRFLFGMRNLNYLNFASEQQFERGYILKRKTRQMLIIGFWYVFLFQIFGIALLFCYFFFTVPDSPTLQQLNYYYNFKNSFWSACFHSISAANNAGFDVFNEGIANNSLQAFRNHYFVQIVFMVLFILGGMGFPFFLELHEKIKNTFQRQNQQIYRFSFFVKFSVISYFVVTVIGLGLAFSFEAAFTNDFQSNQSSGSKSMSVIFNILSTRSAGFSTAPIDTSFSAPTRMLMTLLMFIGSAPLSTGGGIKVTTFVILIYGLFGRYDKKNNLIIGKGAISIKKVFRAFLIFFLAIGLIFIYAVIGSAVSNPTSEIAVELVLFDAVSALGNVGLSMINLVDKQWPFYKVGTIILMLIGQLGLGNFQILLKQKRLIDHERYPSKVVF